MSECGREKITKQKYTTNLQLRLTAEMSRFSTRAND